jgi:diguanylate cyclase (GGDEF)-like protein
MTPFYKRNLLVFLLATFLVALLVCLKYLVPMLEGHIQHLEFLILSILVMITFLVMFSWVTMGVLGGLSSFFITLIFIYKPLTALDPIYYSILIIAFFLNSFIGNRIHRAINKSNQEYTVSAEKIQEDTNLIQNHFKNRTAEIKAMEEKIESLLKLKNISDDLSLVLSSDDIINSVVSKTYEKFKGNTRVIFYQVDANHKFLSLRKTIKDEDRQAAVMKKGGIFERWIMKNMQSLIVKDVRKDYRFSLDAGEREDDFVSLIGKPLVSEGKLLGILRVDSNKEEAFSQHELRILDIIGEISAVAMENAKLYEKTEELAIRDSLTGLFVHRYFMERLVEEVRRGLRSELDFAVLLMDIDNFKQFNDKYGHVAGDMILKNVSRIIKKKASAGDIICRYGGEEFVFVALNCNKKEATRLAEDIRQEISKSKVAIRREKKSVTVSIGISMFPGDAKIREDLIWKADSRMYEAKTSGKNKVCSG